MSFNLPTLADPDQGSAGRARSSSVGVDRTAPQPGLAADSTAEHTAKILVVEDDPRSARLFDVCLSAIGHRVTLVPSAEEALAVLGAERPDLILCDICLPGIDGIEFTRQIRAAGEVKEVLLMMVTSLDDRKVLTRSLDAGADDIFFKPVNAVELRTRIHSLLRNKILTDELRRREITAQSSFPVSGDRSN